MPLVLGLNVGPAFDHRSRTFGAEGTAWLALTGRKAKLEPKLPGILPVVPFGRFEVLPGERKSWAVGAMLKIPIGDWFAD